MTEPGGMGGYAGAAILALGGGLDRATALLIEPVEGVHRLVGWASLPLVAGDGTRHALPRRLAQATEHLGRQLRRPLWQASGGGPYLHDPEPALGLALGHVVAVADPLPPLRVWIAGLSAGESLAAAQEAITAAPCEAIALYRFRPEEDPVDLSIELAAASPDVIVVAGGYDHPDDRARQPVLALCQLIALAVRRLHPSRRPMLCFAGNRWAAAAVLDLWREVPDVEAQSVLNVLPALGELSGSSLAVAISQCYWARCKADPSLQEISSWLTQPSVMRSYHWSFAQAVRLWREIHQLPHLHALYCERNRWMHVWAAGDGDGVRVYFSPPQMRPAVLERWPPLQLVSGAWPSLWPRPSQSWCEPLGLLPVAASVGQIDAKAALQILTHDLVE